MQQFAGCSAGACQIEFSFYWNQALPLVRTRTLRLAEISPLDMQSPARWSRNVRKTSDEASDENSWPSSHLPIANSIEHHCEYSQL